MRKNAAAKAKALSAQSKAKGKASLAATPKSTVAGSAPGTAVAPGAEAAAVPSVAESVKRGAPETSDAPAGGDVKRARLEDVDTLAKMLVQAVVRVLQNRSKAGKGPLPLQELEGEFRALWKVPFNLNQVGEQDAATFLQKWPSKVELCTEDGEQCIRLAKKTPAPSAKADATKASEIQTAPSTRPTTKVPSVAPAAEPTVATASKSVAAKPASAPVAKVAAQLYGAGAQPSATPGQPSVAKNGSLPKRPPASLEDFLWNIHSVLEAQDGPLPLDSLKEAYSKHLGHRCAIERFLVVGEGGLAATLKRIPHVVTIIENEQGTMLRTTQPAGTTKEGLVAADLAFRRQLVASKESTGTPATSTAKEAVAEAKAPEPSAGQTSAGQKRPTETPTSGEKETLSRMLVLGVVRVVQKRVREGKGPLPVSKLEEEFSALWKVPFNLTQAGETDVVSFLKKHENRILIVNDGGEFVVQLPKKASEKEGAKAPTAVKAGVTATSLEPPPKVAGALPSRGVAPVTEPAVADVPNVSVAAGAAPEPVAPVVPEEAPVALLQAAPLQAALEGDELVEVPQSLSKMRLQASRVLAKMRIMMREQEALVEALAQFDAS